MEGSTIIRGSAALCFVIQLAHIPFGGFGLDNVTIMGWTGLVAWRGLGE